MEQSPGVSWRNRAAAWFAPLFPFASTKTWSSDAAAFAIRCEEFDGSLDVGELVCQLAKMLDDAPPSLSDVIGERPRVKLVEGQLAAEAFESAALSLAGAKTGYMLSRAPDGTSMASVWLSGVTEEQTLKAPDTAVAICGAIALACLSAVSTDPTLLRSPII
ncbi:MAG: hypothetical protein ACK4NZ_04335 [Tsuneonella sp.]